MNRSLELTMSIRVSAYFVALQETIQRRFGVYFFLVVTLVLENEFYLVKTCNNNERLAYFLTAIL